MGLATDVRPIVHRARWYLRARLTSVVVLAAVVACTGAIALTLLAGALRTASAADRYSAWRGDVYDYAIEQSSGPPLTDEIAALPAVASVELAAFVFGGLIPAGGDATVDAIMFAGSPEAFGTRLVDGRAPEAPGEFAATRSWLAAADAAIGDEFVLITITQERSNALGFDAEPDGPSIDAVLVGVIDSPAELIDGFPLALFPPTLLDVGDIGVSSSPGFLALEPDASLADLRAQLDTLHGDQTFGLAVAEWVPAEVRSGVSTQARGLMVLASIAIVAVVVIVGQLVVRQVRVPRSVRTTMSAIGMSRPQLLAEPVGRAAVPIAAGAAIAALVAYAASGVFPVGFAELVEPHPGRRLDVVVHLLGPVLLTLALLAWVLLATVLDGRETTVSRSPRPVEHVASRIPSATVATSIRFAFAPPSGDGGSRAGPMVGLALVVSVLVGAVTFAVSVARLIDEPARWGANFDLGVGQGGTVIPDDVETILASDPDVIGLTRYGLTYASVGDADVEVIGFAPIVGDVVPEPLAGRLPVADDEVVLGRVTATGLGVGVGDELTVSAVDGSRTYRIVGLAVIPPGIEGADGVGQGALVTMAGLDRLDREARSGSAAIRLRPGAGQEAAERLFETTGMAIGPFNVPPVIVGLTRVRAIPFLVAATLGLLTALGLAHQMITSTRRRGRDIAVLRSLGADRWWVTRVLHGQATVFALAVLALAGPVGFVGGRLVYRAYVDGVGVATDVAVPFGLLSTLALVVIGLANLVTVFPARRARRLPPSRLLADE